MGVAICGIVMFFAALVSASIVRRGLGAADWRPFEIPRVLWLNTAILLASSFTITRARRLELAADEAGFRHWWSVTTILGILFLAGQLIAWRQLAAAGMYVAANPTAGFFYVFTGAHGLHSGRWNRGACAGGSPAGAMDEPRNRDASGGDLLAFPDVCCGYFCCCSSCGRSIREGIYFCERLELCRPGARHLESRPGALLRRDARCATRTRLRPAHRAARRCATAYGFCCSPRAVFSWEFVR